MHTYISIYTRYLFSKLYLKSDSTIQTCHMNPDLKTVTAPNETASCNIQLLIS